MLTCQPSRSAGSILPIEREFVTHSVECAAAWNPKGELLYSECGPFEDHVELPDNVNRAIVGGGKFTHNHPGGDPWWSFSLEDVKWAAAMYLDEVRAVGTRHGKIVVSVIRFPYEALAMPDVAYELEVRKQVKLHPDDQDYQEYVWRALAARYGFEYEAIEDL